MEDNQSKLTLEEQKYIVQQVMEIEQLIFLHNAKLEDRIDSFEFQIHSRDILEDSPHNEYFKKKLKVHLDRLKALKAKAENINTQTGTKTEQENQGENNFTLSTIEDWLYEFKEQMSEPDYERLVTSLINYFKTGTFPKLSKSIQINGRPNKKLFGWALNRIFESQGKGVEKDLLVFAKKNISLFADVKFDEDNILQSNLYKYFTTKIK